MSTPKALNDSRLSLYDFMMLDRASQWALILTESRPISQVRVDDKVFRLYAINAFYVEVQTELFTDKFMRMSIFKTGKKLEKYFGGVAITIPSN